MNMESGTKFIREINDQFLICKICHETYRDPKILTCLHTFCSDCIQHHVDSERERASRFSMYNIYVNCPLCRKKTEIPNGGVRRLTDNFLVSNLTDVVNRRRSVKKSSCEICQTMPTRTNQACSKCLECSKLLCKTCVGLHRKTKVTEQHSLFDIEDEKDVECKVHPDEVIRFFCEPCETCVCILCTFQEHNNHEVCSFSEGLSKNKGSLDILLHMCRERETDVQSLLNTINKCETLKKETEDSIRDLAISFTARVRSMEKKLLKKVESAFVGAELTVFIQTKDWLLECLDNIKSTCNLTDILLKDRNLEMLLLKKEIHGKLATLLEPVLPTVPVDLSTEIQFIPGTVKLGYLSFTKDLDDSDSLSTDAKCVHTQTDTISLDNSSTSMGVDVTEPLRSKALQTDPPPLTQTANKEVCTIPVQTKDKGVHAPVIDVKSKGVVTEKTILHAVKSQTDKLQTYDMANMTTLYSQDACVYTPTLETFEQYSQTSPDVKSRGNLVNLPNVKLVNAPISYQFAHPSNVSSENYNVNDLNDFTNGWNSDRTNTVSELTDMTYLIQDRGVQTVVSAKNPLHKATKTTSVMTDTEKIFEDSIGRSFKQSKTSDTYPTESCEPLVNVNSSDKATNTCVAARDASTTCELMTVSIKHQSTCTPSVEVSEFETQTTMTETKEKATWKYVRQSNQATATDTYAKSHLLCKGTNTLLIHRVNKGSNAAIETANVSTEMLPRNGSNETRSHCYTSTDTLHQIDEEIERSQTLPHMFTAVPKLFPIRDIAEEPPHQFVDNYTAMSLVQTQNREACTLHIPLSDKWTGIEVTQVANASTATNKRFTKDKGVVTPTTMTLDQFTNTHIIECRECEIEAVVTTTDNETLTDTTVFSDAQTDNDTTYTDNTIWIDFHSQQEVHTMTDMADLKDEDVMVRPFMFNKRTSTSPGVGHNTTSIDGVCQTEFAPLLTRSLPESLMTFFPGPPSEPYNEISISVPTMERGTMYSPTLTCDRSTMALSIISTDETLSVYTQTPLHTQLDSGSSPSSFDNEVDVSFEEKATSTESLVYMGLLSQLDNIDELFFVPNVTLETVSSATSLSDMSMETDHIEMLDQEMCTDEISLYDCGTQTYLTLAPDEDFFPNHKGSMPCGSFNTSTVIDASTNTIAVRTMCRVTCTPPRHQLSKSTMTRYVAKSDKCTNTARRANRWYFHPISTSDIGVSTDSLAHVDKDTMTSQCSIRDSSVSTNSVLVDGKMAECIVKLKNVSDRLHSPTQKSKDDNIFSSRNQLARQKKPGLEDMVISPTETHVEQNNSSSIRSLSEGERKQQVQELVLQTQITLQKSRPESSRKVQLIPESPHKVQPITTLKTKSGDRLAAIEEENYKSRSLPRQFPDRECLTGVRMGRQAMTPSRLPLLRYNSAPGRIATVPTQKLNILPRSPTHISPMPPSKIPSAVKVLEQMPQQWPSLVVADRQSSSQLPFLPVISETRTPSSSSNCSGVSCSSVEASSPGIVSSDVVPQQLSNKPLVTLYSSSSTSSIQSMADPQKSSRNSTMSFMQRLLPRKKKASKAEGPQPRSSSGSLPKQPESPKTPISPKKSRPFVYMRQRIFSIQHDGESSKSPKEKSKKGKTKTKAEK